MNPTNLERMIALATEVFDARNDPEQISVTEEDVERLRAIHPATMTQKEDENGPIAWVLVFPTTHDLMDLLWMTPLRGKYEALYLCSALILPEYRGKGVAKELTLEAVRSIRKDHPIRELFYWPFSDEGAHLAVSVAREAGLLLGVR